ncbi:MAG: hypothetical protein PHG06_12020 [Parabacteroides sp.]|nr:hypothetical protein [Parabacteroides sp.]MDK2978029.1 hypothetical protein [Bacteroidales bacterium]
MTHTLHRLGNSESLRHDIVFTYMPSNNINHVGSAPKLRKFLEICRDLGAIKIGDTRKGNEYVQGSLENMLNNIEDRAVVEAVFDNEIKAINALKAIKEADLGLSLVVSGLFEQTRECCRKAGLNMHTVNQSLGIWGRTDKLPEKRGILELNTMCGHGMVSVSFIEYAVKKIKTGKWTPEKAAENLFKCCVCGIVNTTRAVEILKELSEEKG